MRSVLATLRQHEVPYLMMGGQACILYGAGEFSRDLDVVLAARPEGFERLCASAEALRATPIAVPPLRLDLLERGHVVHLRCERADTAGLRLDVTTRPPRIGDPSALWDRAAEVATPDGERLPVLGLADLVATKKTQRDKDWAIIGALIDADIARHPGAGTAQRRLWLQEARDADVLLSLVVSDPALAAEVAAERSAVRAALAGNREQLELELAYEQIRGRAADRVYWAPLIKEQEEMRRAARRERPGDPGVKP